jgi:hypothetical protein
VIEIRQRTDSDAGSPASTAERWVVIEGDPTLAGDSMDSANQRLVDDLMAAIHGDDNDDDDWSGHRTVAASAERASKAQEMVMAVFKAGVSRQRVSLPLADRSHPLQESSGKS